MKWLWILALPVSVSTSTIDPSWLSDYPMDSATNWSIMITTSGVVNIGMKKPGDCIALTKEIQGVLAFSNEHRQIEPVKKICVKIR